MNIKCPSFEHVGSPLDPSTFLQEKAIKVAPSRTITDASGSGDDDWMDGLPVAGVIRKFGVDPNAVLSSDGILRTPEGLDYEDSSSGNSGSLSSESSNSSGSDEDNASTSSSKPLIRTRVSDDPSSSGEYRI